MIINPFKTRIFTEGENLFDFVVEHIQKIPEKSVIVVTSKIVALAENRTASSGTEKDKVKIIKAESDYAVETKHVWLTLKDGMMMASAGIDESNANGKIVLLPKNSFTSAFELREKLQNKFGIKELGVLITDSRTAPLRAGVTGVALGYAGFFGLKDYIGKPDIFKRPFKFSRVNVADSLATSAVFCMGEGNEQQPLALISESGIQFIDALAKENELRIDVEDDMYSPLFEKFPKKNKK